MTDNNPDHSPTPESSLEALFLLAEIENPQAFERHHAQVYSRELVVGTDARRGLAELLARNTRTAAGPSLAAAALEQVTTDAAGVVHETVRERVNATRRPLSVIAVRLDPDTGEVTGVFKRTEMPGPTARAVSSKQESLRKIGWGQPPNALSGGMDRRRSLPGSGAVKVA